MYTDISTTTTNTDSTTLSVSTITTTAIAAKKTKNCTTIGLYDMSEVRLLLLCKASMKTLKHYYYNYFYCDGYYWYY